MNLRYLKNGETLMLSADACTGCGRCIEVCPHAVFTLAHGKASIADRGACMECGACMRNCAAGAIRVKAGVGCAAAIIGGLVRGTEPSCGGDCGCSTIPVAGGKAGAKSGCC
jgi:NAD-dependent dihydropyrimidine dehydrogenase PreA subunit